MPTELEKIRQKIESYCAYQDRCHAEVRDKLWKLGARGEEVDYLLGEMITTGFLNEERFARSFTRGRFRIKGWGKEKIRQALRMKRIHDKLINRALDEEIDQEEYWEKLKYWAERKYPELKTKYDGYVSRGKLKEFLVKKGFAYDLVNEITEEIIKASEDQESD